MGGRSSKDCQGGEGNCASGHGDPTHPTTACGGSNVHSHASASKCAHSRFRCYIIGGLNDFLQVGHLIRVLEDGGEVVLVLRSDFCGHLEQLPPTAWLGRRSPALNLEPCHFWLRRTSALSVTSTISSRLPKIIFNKIFRTLVGLLPFRPYPGVDFVLVSFPFCQQKLLPRHQPLLA